MTREEFAQACAAPLEAAFGKQDKTALEMYYSFLKDLGVDLLAAAVAKCICETKWCPKIAEIRSAAADIASGQWQQLSVGEAWALAQKAIPLLPHPDVGGSYDRARAAVPQVVFEAMQAAGLRALCDNSPIWAAKAFAAVWPEIAARDRKRLVAPPSVVKAIDHHRNMIASQVARIGMEAPDGKAKPDTKDSQVAQRLGVAGGNHGAMVPVLPPPY